MVLGGRFRAMAGGNCRGGVMVVPMMKTAGRPSGSRSSQIAVTPGIPPRSARMVWSAFSRMRGDGSDIGDELEAILLGGIGVVVLPAEEASEDHLLDDVGGLGLDDQVVLLLDQE